MKFFGNGAFWDVENNKPLCEFVNGEFETDDTRIITILTTAGYKSEKVETDAEDEVSGSETVVEEKESDLEQSTSKKGKKILKSKTE